MILGESDDFLEFEFFRLYGGGDSVVFRFRKVVVGSNGKCVLRSLTDVILLCRCVR